jgi:hypothetical protein
MDLSVSFSSSEAAIQDSLGRQPLGLAPQAVSSRSIAAENSSLRFPAFPVLDFRWLPGQIVIDFLKSRS